ncbi:DUF4333 domain-containing protein [Mycobacterium sp. Y57]|uniref:DUF4333 domain-containing protein n=1 Tax=Mycolicibacterium xanthum TaxID=2796469 RepID=UPI001C843F77|nr:DUF4333 domain-containing protein [Mycolicibacterium xanthum]MBX7435179.1 DUF4333 domain-containing protein [Mycolicibacterium xanthum]
MATRTLHALLVTGGAALALTACSFSIGAGGGLDFEKLQSAITDELNKSYAPISQEVTSVECPTDEPRPAPGATLVCTAQVADQEIRVESTVTNEDYDVNFKTLDSLYDLPSTSDTLSDELTDQLGFPVTVTCGDGLQAVEIGSTFDCTAADPNGEERTVRVTAGAVGEQDHWELLG